MKKVQLTTAVLVLGWAVAFGQSKGAASRVHTEFRQYISKQIERKITIDDRVQGTIWLRLKMSSTGFDSVYVVNGRDPELNAKLIQIIKNTPRSITTELARKNATLIDVPVSLIVKEN